MESIRHMEIGGGYTMRKKIILDVACMGNDSYEIAALYADGEELDMIETDTEEKAIKEFNKLVKKYAEPLQKTFYNKLAPEKKYTFVYCNDFGYPVSIRVTFKGMTFCTYAQHSDVVRLIYKPYKSRHNVAMYVYDKSFMVLDGWHTFDENDIYDVVSDNGGVTVRKMKYNIFDSQYLEDVAEKYNKYVILFYKDYKTGVDGKLYA